MDGNVTITVPTVTTRSDYIVVCEYLALVNFVCLMHFKVIGTSGDRSPTFTINAV